MIFHIAVGTEWDAAISDGIYAPASLAAEGFIHCSRSEQIITTANLFYRGQQGLMLLLIDETKLVAPLRYETPAVPTDLRAAQSFPHIYGRLNLDAVVRAEAFPCSANGSFELPIGFPD
jgi:uncharacterized protein (DUF952 family)